MDDSFGHWFAGLVDGEGAFMVVGLASVRTNSGLKRWPSCRFELALRADDYEILKTVQMKLGFGSVAIHAKPGFKRPNENASFRYHVQRIDDCMKLVEFFHRYPLRAKKRAQFLVWADAVHEMSKGRDRDTDFLELCRDRLRAMRQYVQPEELFAALADNPTCWKHKRSYGTPPLCLCGCGRATRIFSHSNSVTHPDNPNYCAYTRGHNRRLIGRHPS